MSAIGHFSAVRTDISVLIFPKELVDGSVVGSEIDYLRQNGLSLTEIIEEALKLIIEIGVLTPTNLRYALDPEYVYPRIDLLYDFEELEDRLEELKAAGLMSVQVTNDTLVRVVQVAEWVTFGFYKALFMSVIAEARNVALKNAGRFITYPLIDSLEIRETPDCYTLGFRWVFG